MLFVDAVNPRANVGASVVENFTFAKPPVDRVALLDKHKSTPNKFEMLPMDRVALLDALDMPHKCCLLPEDHVALLDVKDTPNNLSCPQEDRVSLLDALAVPNECVTSSFVIAKHPDRVALATNLCPKENEVFGNAIAKPPQDGIELVKSFKYKLPNVAIATQD